MKKVIISGANGFIGNALVKQLIKKNIFVIALVQDVKKVDIKLLRNEHIQWIEINVDYINDLTNQIALNGADVFYHFAWTGSSGPLRGDYKVQLNNIFNTCDAIRVAKKLGCKKFVFAESIMEYEINKAINLEENVSINTLYSTAKLAAKYMSKTLSQREGIDYVGALISNVYGPGEKSERLINTTLRQLKENKHCSFSSGEQLYDFIYIDDAAEILRLIGESGKKNRTYYIGNSEQRKLKEYLIDLFEVVAEDEKLNKSLLGFGELPQPTTVLNFNEFNTKIVQDEFNFIPKVMFKDGIRRTYISLFDEND